MSRFFPVFLCALLTSATAPAPRAAFDIPWSGADAKKVAQQMRRAGWTPAGQYGYPGCGTDLRFSGSLYGKAASVIHILDQRGYWAASTVWFDERESTDATSLKALSSLKGRYSQFKLEKVPDMAAMTDIRLFSGELDRPLPYLVRVFKDHSEAGAPGLFIVYESPEVYAEMTCRKRRGHLN